jgi:hypothetical protein
MLPNSGGIEEILFPMTADIYYSETIQTEYGNVAKKWTFDRKVKCSMITDMADRSFTDELKTKGTDFIYDSNAYFRCPEDIRKDSSGKYHPITAIAIANAADPNGEQVWLNGQNLRLQQGAVSTKYEIKTIVPTFDLNHNLRHWRIFITKSQNQRWEE